jgi:hypothetical protein
MRLFGIKAALSIATALGLAAGAIVFARQIPAGDPQEPRIQTAPPDTLKHEPAVIARESPGTAYIPRKIDGLILEGYARMPLTPAFSPDGSTLATGDNGFLNL